MYFLSFLLESGGIGIFATRVKFMSIFFTYAHFIITIFIFANSLQKHLCNAG